MTRYSLNTGPANPFDFSLFLTKEESQSVTEAALQSLSDSLSSSTEEYNALHSRQEGQVPNKGGRQGAKEKDEDNSYVRPEEKSGDDSFLRDTSYAEGRHVRYGRPDLKKIISEIAADSLYRSG